MLGFEPKEDGIMNDKPKSLKELILPRLGLSLIGVISIGSTIAALSIFGHHFNVHGDAVGGRSLVFASFASNSLVYIFAYRSMRQPLIRMKSLRHNMPLVCAVLAGLVLVALPFTVPALGKALGIVPLEPLQWLMIAGVALTLLFAVESGKAISNRRSGRGGRL